MYSKNKTNLKKQIEWIVRYWLSKQEDHEELNFFYNYELHQEELSEFIMTEICNRIHELKKAGRKQEYTRQRYNRDGFYHSDSYKEQAEKIHKTNDERYKIHKVNY